jgi:hypothetical protein
MLEKFRLYVISHSDPSPRSHVQLGTSMSAQNFLSSVVKIFELA